MNCEATTTTTMKLTAAELCEQEHLMCIRFNAPIVEKGNGQKKIGGSRPAKKYGKTVSDGKLELKMRLTLWPLPTSSAPTSMGKVSQRRTADHLEKGDPQERPHPPCDRRLPHLTQPDAVPQRHHGAAPEEEARREEEEP